MSPARENTKSLRWRLVDGVLFQGDGVEVNLVDVELIQLGHRSRRGVYLWVVLYTSSGERITVRTGSGYRWTASKAFVDGLLIRYGEVNPDGVVDVEGSRGARVIRWLTVAALVVAAVALAGFFILGADGAGDGLGWVAFAVVPILVAVGLLFDPRPKLIRADVHADHLKNKRTNR